MCRMRVNGLFVGCDQTEECFEINFCTKFDSIGLFRSIHEDHHFGPERRVSKKSTSEQRSMINYFESGP